MTDTEISAGDKVRIKSDCQDGYVTFFNLHGQTLSVIHNYYSSFGQLLRLDYDVDAGRKLVLWAKDVEKV